MQKPELLIPVGNYECLLSAIHNGADAVYLGGKRFGARAYSNNFTEEELTSAIKLCHLYNVKIYVTVNTIIFNEEIENVTSYLEFLYNKHVDAVIMQDIGLINLTRRLFPKLEIHVSTQAHNHNFPGIDYFHQLGCTRVVFDRESSLEEINAITVPIEKEVFIHGALCVCYSGNCLFSALNGYRSANRGMCVGSCRLPYKLEINSVIKKEGYLLSTKDLNITKEIAKIIEANIDSLKIEGRMKGPEYVAVLTKTYRRLIDSYCENSFQPVTSEELNAISQVYNRDFTTGYLFNASNIINGQTSNHQGLKIGKIISGNNQKITIELSATLHQGDAIRIAGTEIGMYVNTLYDKKDLLVSEVKKGETCAVANKERLLIKDYIGKPILKTIDSELNKKLLAYPEKKIPLNITFEAHINEPAVLTISDNQHTVTCTGPVIESAKSRGVSAEKITEQLSKLGNTPFTVSQINIESDDNIFINFKDINEMRRNATTKLIELREGTPLSPKPFTVPKPITSSTTGQISILVRTQEQLEIALRNNIPTIYVSEESLYQKYHDHKNVYLRLNRVRKSEENYQNERLLCTELGSTIKYAKTNQVIGDYYLNISNDYSIASLQNRDIKTITLSVELDKEKLCRIQNKAPCEIIVYGHLECMIIKNNIFNLTNEKAYLIDTNNNKYPLLADNDFTHIIHKEPINHIKDIPYLQGFKSYRLELLDENAAKTQTLINELTKYLTK